MRAKKNVVIIGAGPAGITAAIQLKRYGVDFSLLEKEEIGGLIRNANLVENYPGFPGGISGLELAALFRRQLEEIGVKVNYEEVIQLDHRNGMFCTRTTQRDILSTHVVIASGTKPKKIPISIPNIVSDRIFYEIHQILDIKNKKVVIIGAGDAAFDYALNMSRRNEVLILNRSNKTRCLPLLWERCMGSKNISYLENVHVEKITAEEDKLQLIFTKNDDKKKNRISADYVVVAVGRDPNLDFLDREVKKHFDLLIENNKLHVIGDAKNGVYRQVAICVGDGLRAAMEIYREGVW